MKQFKNEGSFTLIELVIVIGILAVLAVVVILAINPVEFLKQSRDSQRLSELQDINKALGLYQAGGGTDLGLTNKVYVSIPSTYSDCSDLGLPALPSNWFYACSNSTNYRKVDSNGWIPVNFTSISFGTPLNILPIDPINATSTGQYYTYVVGGSWKLTSLFESEKYAKNMNKDGGTDPGLYETGSDLSLAPFQRGLVGYWKFDEGSGTTASDSSGNNYTGTWSGNGDYWDNGKVGGGSGKSSNQTNCVLFNTTSQIDNLSSFTLSAWINTYGWTQVDSLISKGPEQNVQHFLWDIWYNNPSPMHFELGNEGASYIFFNSNQLSWSSNTWYHVAVTFTNIGGMTTVIFYRNNSVVGSGTRASNTNSGTYNLSIGCYNQIVGFHNLRGLIDDVRIYNRALSAAEIAAIYNATK